MAKSKQPKPCGADSVSLEKIGSRLIYAVDINVLSGMEVMDFLTLCQKDNRHAEAYFAASTGWSTERERRKVTQELAKLIRTRLAEARAKEFNRKLGYSGKY